MMTMTTLMATNTSPWCLNSIANTAKASKAVQESTVSKHGTHGIDSLKNHPPIVLHEIPTRISPSSSTANAIVLANDDEPTNTSPVPIWSPNGLK